MNELPTRRDCLRTGAALASALWAGTVSARESRRRVGVIGHTGQGDYGHGINTVWLLLPETEIVGLADADERGRTATAAKLGGVPAYADYREMLAAVRPEIVAVCPRYINEHHDMILAAIAAGAKGIYTEKPFCRTPAEADDIVAACAAAGTKLAIAHRNHYHPVLPVVRRLVHEGEIGRLLEVRCRGKEDQRGGAQDFWVLSGHLFDLARFFAGDAISCSAELLEGDRPVTKSDLVEGPEGIGLIGGNRLHARYEMTSGVPCYYDSIRGAGVPAAGFGIQLIGTKGVFDFRIDVEPLAHLAAGSPFQPDTRPRTWVPVSSGGIGVPEPIPDLKNHVARHVLPARDLIAAMDEARPAACNAEEGRVLTEMIHAAFASHVRNGERVSLPLKSRAHPFATW